MTADGLELAMSARTSERAGVARREVRGDRADGCLQPGISAGGRRGNRDDEVALDTIDPLKPATLRAAGGDDFLYLLMPVRTS